MKEGLRQNKANRGNDAGQGDDGAAGAAPKAAVFLSARRADGRPACTSIHAAQAAARCAARIAPCKQATAAPRPNGKF